MMVMMMMMMVQVTGLSVTRVIEPDRYHQRLDRQHRLDAVQQPEDAWLRERMRMVLAAVLRAVLVPMLMLLESRVLMPVPLLVLRVVFTPRQSACPPNGSRRTPHRKSVASLTTTMTTTMISSHRHPETVAIIALAVVLRPLQQKSRSESLSSLAALPTLPLVIVVESLLR